MTRLLSVSILLIILFSANAYGRKFCEPNDKGECDYQKYIKEVIIPLGAGIVLAVLSIIAFIAFFSGRFCCNCWGGRDKSAGICCPSRENFEGYSRTQVISVKVGVIICACVFLACGVVGFLGNRSVGTGANNMVDTIIHTGDNLIDKAATIGAELSNLTYTKDIGQSILQVTNSANEFLQQGKKIQSQVHEYNDYRFIALIIAFALPLLLLILGVVAAIFNLRRLALVAGMLCFFCSFFIWISGGLHIFIFQVSEDVCKEIDDYYSQSANTTANSTSASGLNIFLSCSDGGGFGAYKELALQSINQSNYDACDAVIQLCENNQTRPQNCPNLHGTNCTTENLKKVDQIMFDDYALGCRSSPNVCPNTTACIDVQDMYVCSNESITIRDCSTKCKNAELKDKSNHTVFYLDLRQKYQDLFDNEILPLLTCDDIKAGIDTVRHDLCVNVKRALLNVGIASVVLGVFLVPATILLIVGFKRFRSTGNTEDEDHIEDVPMETKYAKKVEVNSTSSSAYTPTASPEPSRKNENESQAKYATSRSIETTEEGIVISPPTEIVIINGDEDRPSKRSSPSSSEASDEEQPPTYNKKRDSFSGIDQTILELSNDLDIVIKPPPSKLPPPESPPESDDEDVKRKSDDESEKRDESEEEREEKRSVRSEKSDGSEKSAKSGKSAKSEKSEKSQKSEKSMKSEKSAKSERSEAKKSSSSSSSSSEDEKKDSSDEEKAHKPPTPNGSDDEN